MEPLKTSEDVSEVVSVARACMVGPIILGIALGLASTEPPLLGLLLLPRWQR